MPSKQHALKSDLDRIDKLRDEDIDYSDIPDLANEVFAKPLAPWPPKISALLTAPYQPS